MRWLHRIIMTLLIAGILFILGFSLEEAGEYYLTEQTIRPYMEQHSQWKPSGFYGHGLGILGTLLILGLLLYSIRKRFRFFRRWGYLSTWLRYHIFMGVAGPLLIVFHTTLKFNGLVSISFWSMVAVAISGFIGRYIYIQIPRARNGIELSVTEIEELKKKLTKDLMEKYRLEEKHFKRLEGFSAITHANPGYLYIFFVLPMQNVLVRFSIYRFFRRISKGESHIPRDELKVLRKTLVRYVTLTRRLAVLDKVHRLFHSWHVVHKPFAYVMIIIMVIHVSAATYMGFTWIF